jgi:hypothetical protein
MRIFAPLVQIEGFSLSKDDNSTKFVSRVEWKLNDTEKRWVTTAAAAWRDTAAPELLPTKRAMQR